MTKMVFEIEDNGERITPLGLLCRRPHFATFDEMVSRLIEVDSSVRVVSDGMNKHLGSYEECLYQDILPGSRGAKSLILLRTLFDANPAAVKCDGSEIIHSVSRYLRGELGVSVLSLFLSKDSSGLKALKKDGCLPIHMAVSYSCLKVVKFLHKAWPESISMVDGNGRSLLHAAVIDENSDTPVLIAKMQYICDQCPALIHLEDSVGDTALHDAFMYGVKSTFHLVKTLCNIDATVVRDLRNPSDITDSESSGQLPLHRLINTRPEMSEVSDEGDCFRLLLSLYPAAAGVKDGLSRSPYDVAVSTNLSAYFIRLLLAADPTIDPVRRHDLNFVARRQGMFLAFSASSSNVGPMIWAKIRLNGRDVLQHVISYL
jgi:ankyrin repeat protein